MIFPHSGNSGFGKNQWKYLCREEKHKAYKLHYNYNQYIDLAKPKSGACISFFSRAQCLALARIRTQVIQLRAQCTDHWTIRQSQGIGVPAVQLTTHVKSSTLYSRTVVHPSFFGLMGYYYLIMGLHSASSAINTNLLHYLICLYFQGGYYSSCVNADWICGH